MKTLLTTTLVLIASLFHIGSANALEPVTNQKLQKEITNLVKYHTLTNMEADTEEVTVHFVINAQNELVIFDAYGNNEEACAHVKDVLSFRQVKYRQAKQLTPYIINIRFVKQPE
jgi:hypothetical protein